MRPFDELKNDAVDSVTDAFDRYEEEMEQQDATIGELEADAESYEFKINELENTVQAYEELRIVRLKKGEHILFEAGDCAVTIHLDAPAKTYRGQRGSWKLEEEKGAKK